MLGDVRLYLVCDAIDDTRLDAALSGGAQIVQLRMKAARDDEIIAAGRRFAAVCALHGVPLIVNDRPELVAPIGASGVHLGQDDAPVAAVRALLGPDTIIGLSTHTPAQIDQAHGVDYIGVGPVHTTPTKPGRPAVGTELVRYAAARARQPFFAIGGIDPHNIAAVIDAGATRVAVVRAITEAADPRTAAQQLRAALEVTVGAT